MENTSQINGTIRSWFSALKYSWRTALQIDRSQLTAVRAIRSTIGVAIPLALSVATGYIPEGVSIAGGAVSLGSVGLSDPHRVRARTMLLACVGVAISAFVGSITSHIGWLAVLVVGLWGFGAGLLVSLGQSAMIIGLQSTIALIILSYFALDPAHAALQAALMLVGALFQTILALIPVPGQRTARELTALSSVYQALAAYAANLTDEQYGQQVRDALLKAHAVILESDHQRQQDAILSELLEEAERLRLTILIFRKWRQHLKEDPMVRTSSNIEYIDQFLQAAAAQLEEIANELKPTPRFVSRVKPHQQIKQSLTVLRRQGTMSDGEEALQPVVIYGEALRDQLHIAKKLAKSWKHRQPHQPIHFRIAKPAPLQLHSTYATIRANLTLRSAAFRHAIRLGITLAIATALYKLTPLPIHNGYWTPLTALLVLRPDFSTTVVRGIARTLGTVLGAVLAAILVSQLAPTKELLILLEVIVTYLAFSVLLVNYALFSLFIIAIREGQSVSTFPNLQEMLQVVRRIRRQETHMANDVRINLRLVLIEIKRIICTLNTMHQLIECSNLSMRNPDT